MDPSQNQQRRRLTPLGARFLFLGVLTTIFAAVVGGRLRDDVPDAEETARYAFLHEGVLRGYLVLAGGLVLWRIVELAFAVG